MNLIKFNSIIYWNSPHLNLYLHFRLHRFKKEFLFIPGIYSNRNSSWTWTTQSNIFISRTRLLELFFPSNADLLESVEYKTNYITLRKKNYCRNLTQFIENVVPKIVAQDLHTKSVVQICCSKIQDFLHAPTYGLKFIFLFYLFPQISLFFNCFIKELINNFRNQPWTKNFNC